MVLEDKFEEQLADFPKLYGISCLECVGEIEYLGRRRGEEKLSYEYVCNDCGMIHSYRKLMDELRSKWPYNVLCRR